MEKCVKLANGLAMPLLGLGTWEMQDEARTVEVIEQAIELGYRHIDTAAIYKNEAWIGSGIRTAGAAREELFVTTKLWTTEKTFDDTLRAFHRSLKDLRLDYIDLYLLHYPKPCSGENWRALERLYREGLVRSIGVSNFLIHHLELFLPGCEIAPMVNQVEFHPHLVQPELRQYCRTRAIQLEAWAPLNQGRVNDIPLVVQLGEKYGKTPAQIVLRWDIQQHVVTIPKTVKRHRLMENRAIFDFTLSEEDMRRITELDQGRRYGPDPDDNPF